jgi:hypothetical protein
MAQTDARPGFRLPWSSDRQSTDPSDGEPTTDQQVADAGWPSDDAARSNGIEHPAATDLASPAADLAPAVEATPAVEVTSAVEPRAASTTAESAGAGKGAATPPPPARKPTKFMADLTKAMQAAAEDARSRAMTQLQADAKTHVETIHGRSATEAADLRRGADDDVAAVREWSKAEIARIREETEAKIADRKSRLESEIQEHGGVIEREIEAVQKTVAAFEEDMTAFFERLLGEEDPSRFATMAENLPEPPTFEDIVGEPAPEAIVEVEPEAVVEVEPEAEASVETVEAVESGEIEPTVAESDTAVEGEAPHADVETETDAAGTAEPTDAEAAEAIEISETSDTTQTSDATNGAIEGAEGGAAGDGVIDREAAFAAIQAAAEAAASAEVAADAAARAEAVADVAIEIIGNHDDEAEEDPRFAALGLSPDYDAAEAEAFAAASTSEEEVPEIDNDALAARIAGLVPSKSKGNSADAAATQIVVVGLVSVASIASFKRHLGRVTGVQSVGVSSGPDGEFVFAVSHGSDVALRDAIPSLPSFQARVTGSADGVIHVTAHDPESDA